MAVKRSIGSITGKILLVMFIVAMLGLVAFGIFILVADSEDKQTRNAAMPYQDAVVIGIPETANSFIDEWEYTINGKSFGEIAETYALPEADSDIIFYPGIKYVADDSNAMTDYKGMNQTFYFGKDKDNLVCALETYNYYTRSTYINKNYVFPEAGENKAVGLILCDDYGYLADYTTSKELHLFDPVDEIHIDDPEIAERAVNEYITETGDFSWLKEHFNFENDRDYIILVKFENEIVYQLIGRVKADISNREEIVSAAWKDVCDRGHEQNYNKERYDIFVTENSYRVRFFSNDSEYDNYDLVKLEKSTLKPNYNL